MIIVRENSEVVIIYPDIYIYWLVVLTILKNISQWVNGKDYPIYYGEKNMFQATNQYISDIVTMVGGFNPSEKCETTTTERKTKAWWIVLDHEMNWSRLKLEDFFEGYTLVNCYIAMENHQF